MMNISFIHSFTYAFTHSLTPSLSNSLKQHKKTQNTKHANHITDRHTLAQKTKHKAQL